MKHLPFPRFLFYFPKDPELYFCVIRNSAKISTEIVHGKTLGDNVWKNLLLG